MFTVVEPVSVEQTPEHSSSPIFSAATPPSHIVLLQDALHRFDRPFLCPLCSLFQWVSLPNYTPMTILTLFAALAYAAPVAPEGAIVKRQGCMGPLCREAVSVGAMSLQDVVA